MWAATAHLIAGTPKVRIGTVRARGRIEYRGKDERPLTRALPVSPAAVRIYAPDGTCRTLVLDLDAKNGHNTLDVDRDAADLRALLHIAGLRFLEDQSPTGGRHIYIPLAVPLDQPSARELVEALALRTPSLDPSPHQSARTGCIRTPGSAHATSGHQQLIGSLNAAVDALYRRNPATAVQQLQEHLSEELRTLNTPLPTAPDTAVDTGRGISARITELARHGHHPGNGYATPSEARQAVITATVRAGWSLGHVATRVSDGRWPGLAGMYSRYSPGNRKKALARDWRKAAKFLASRPLSPGGETHVHRSNTSGLKSQGGRDDHAFIRTWRATVRSFELSRMKGRRWHAARFLLRALGEAAHKTGDRRVAFGCRALAVATGIEYSTASIILRQLTEAGWIDLLEPGRGEHADLFELTIPKDLVDLAPDLRWERGKVHALRPAFRELGPVAAFVFEAIETGRATTTTTLPQHTGVSLRAAHQAVELLTAVGLVSRTDGQLVAHPHLLLVLAEDLGVNEAIVTQLRRYAQQRADWRAYLTRHEAQAEVVDDVEAYWWPPDDGSGWQLIAA